MESEVQGNSNPCKVGEFCLEQITRVFCRGVTEVLQVDLQHAV